MKIDLTHRHQSLRQHVKLVRVANAHVRSLDEVNRLHLKPRRVWIGLTDPSSLHWSLESEAHEALQVWAKSWCPPLSLCQCRRRRVWRSRPRRMLWLLNPWPVWGGAAFFPNGSCVWVQFRITLAEASEAWSWVGNDMQKHIAWELLAQFALTFCIESSLPRCRGPVNVNRERTTALRTQPRQRAFL